MKLYIIEHEFTSINDHYCYIIIDNCGYRCGYVGVSPTSILANLPYHESSIYLENLTPLSYYQAQLQLAINNITVHGGLSYAGIRPNKPYYYFGFDCKHSYDAPDLAAIENYKTRFYENPSIPEQFPVLNRKLSGTAIRTLDFCIDQCNQLSNQLYEIEQKFAYYKTSYPELYI